MNGDYIKYQHVEKLGSDDVDGILFGDVYVFPKLDGTNSHAWFDGEEMHYGSRNRELSADNDNAGFMSSMLKDTGLTELCKSLPNVHVFGEWLVPHSLKTYRDDAWRKFYVFDMVSHDDGGVHYYTYEALQIICEAYGVEYISPLRIIKNPSIDNVMRVLDDNIFLVEDGKGTGEGVVLKNYKFKNKYGRIVWAKVVTSEFKEMHTKSMGAPLTKGTDFIEEKIVGQYVTKALVEKTVAKIKNDNDGWSSKYISQMLGTVFHDLVTEHTWDAVKKHKMPRIDFKTLNRFCTLEVKNIMPELF
jgi:hypothetical protein